MHKECNNGKLVSAEHIQLFSEYCAWACKTTRIRIPCKNHSEIAQEVRSSVPDPANKQAELLYVRISRKQFTLMSRSPRYSWPRPLQFPLRRAAVVAPLPGPRPSPSSTLESTSARRLGRRRTRPPAPRSPATTGRPAPGSLSPLLRLALPPLVLKLPSSFRVTLTGAATSPSVWNKTLSRSFFKLTALFYFLLIVFGKAALYLMLIVSSWGVQ